MKACQGQEIAGSLPECCEYNKQLNCETIARLIKWVSFN